MRILLIAGGWSNERQVSLNGAAQIDKSLQSLGHEVVFFDLSPELNNLIKAASRCDAAFINLHGCPGEDGTIQALLDDIGIPYQGSGPLGSFLALNKHLSKQILRNHGLITPNWFLVTNENQELPPRINFPVVAKPNTGGSSLDIAILQSSTELKHYLKQPGFRNQEILLEEYIEGVELTCAVVDDRTLPPILIKPLKGNFFDYSSKYDPDGASEICPAPVSEQITSQLQELSLKTHKILGLRHYSRTDFILDTQNNLYLLETNTLPGMTQTSLVPKAALAAGLDFTALADKLLSLAVNSVKTRTTIDHE
ncbi:MAG: D-alanine--D-alanine ligase [Desulfonatronovibrio sp.]